MNEILLKNRQSVILQMMEEGESLLKQIQLTDLSSKINQQCQLMKTKTTPTIMFYGLYNAGKSTIINALCRETIAKVADVPTTAAVQAISWEGYTLIDTPGINANDVHTQIAVNEVDSSDIILFIVDNGDGFERDIVAQTITTIIQRKKAVAIVVNQKNVNENEDENQPVPTLPSMKKIENKILNNLHRKSLAAGLDILHEKNFLGIYSINAAIAIDAEACTSSTDKECLYQISGINSLVNVIDKTIRASARVQTLLTPIGYLKERLNEALDAYSKTDIFGHQEEYAKERKILVNSRQHMGERLQMDGLRKIEAAFEQIQILGLQGQPFDHVAAQLQQDLTALIQTASNQEVEIVSNKLNSLSLPNNPSNTEGMKKADDPNDTALAIAAAEAVKFFIMPEIPIATIPILIEVVIKILRIILRPDEQDRDESAERMAAYYKWQNELRDQEVQAKANYSASVDNVLKTHFDAPLEELDRQLSKVSDACSEHTDYMRKLEKLLIRVNSEIADIMLTL
ncbi:MAG: 50S ribosome-binding GTPase [Oscillospiraceae bacterium]|nr:50S ribosome-binding GTPase [Oscillospiraceae bacterium]